MEIKDLNKKYESMQKTYGDKSLDAIINGGCEVNPDVCFVFMNPTGRNIASVKSWQGRKSPWLGTKNIWKLFYRVGLMNEQIYSEIQSRKPFDWDERFADEVYEEVVKQKFFITNLGKCTQIDARPLPDSVYKEYLDLLYEEISILNPKKIITFGNQISSIFLGETINVSKCRKQAFKKEIGNHIYDIYPVFYPVGNGMRNIDMAVEDIVYICGKR